MRVLYIYSRIFDKIFDGESIYRHWNIIAKTLVLDSVDTMIDFTPIDPLIVDESTRNSDSIIITSDGLAMVFSNL